MPYNLDPRDPNEERPLTHGEIRELMAHMRNINTTATAVRQAIILNAIFAFLAVIGSCLLLGSRH